MRVALGWFAWGFAELQSPRVIRIPLWNRGLYCFRPEGSGIPLARAEGPGPRRPYETEAQRADDSNLHRVVRHAVEWSGLQPSSPLVRPIPGPTAQAIRTDGPLVQKANAECSSFVTQRICLATLFVIGIWFASSSRASDNRPLPPPTAERLPLQRYEYDFVAMGMKYHLVVYAPDQPTVTRALEQVEARVRHLDRVMSDYHTESELSQLCEHSSTGQPVRLSPELYEILDHSQELSRETDGAFDVTVGPVIQLWRTARRTKTLPSPELLAKARERIGWRAVQLDPLARSAELTRDEMQLDLGGIAAGYACDEALQVLRSHGLPRVLIDASGDVLVGDPPPDREGWKVTVAGLSGGVNDPGSRTILLSNASITTSGDARQFVEIDGQRYSHIVDPQTGLGLTRRSSTTVIAPTGWQADSYATAVNVLGAQAGIPWIEQHPGCSALMIELQNGVEVRTESRGFPPVTP